MRVSTFKPQYRQAPPRAATPPPPAYEPLSPVLRPLEHDTHAVRASARAPDSASAAPACAAGLARDQHASAHSRAPRGRLQLSPPARACEAPLRSAPLPAASTLYSPALGSPIEALADAAVSSLQASPAYVHSSRRPSFTPISPATVVPTALSGSHNSAAPRAHFEHVHTHQERPAKRARSEFFSAQHTPVQHGQRHARPATSHIPDWSYNVEQMVDNGVRMYQGAGPMPHHEDTHSKRLSDAQLLLDFHNAISIMHTAPLQPSMAKRWSIAHVGAPRQQPSSKVDSSEAFASAAARVQNEHHDPALALASRRGGFGLSPRSGTHLGAPDTSKAVQTHTPPEDAVGALNLDPTDMASATDNGETNHPYGWRAGEALGSRPAAVEAETDASIRTSKHLPNKATSGPDQLQSPQSLAAEQQGAHSPPHNNENQHEEHTAQASPSRVRRHSYSEMLSPKDMHAMPRQPTSPFRAQSLPLAEGMLAISDDHANSNPTRLRDTDDPICAGCHSFVSVTSVGDGEQWISCDGCKGWFHYSCAGFNSEREVREIDKFYCGTCQPKYGNTTRVRKSRRAHTAVDYAGLNEGILKTSDDNPEHHYIRAFKNGDIKFTPESFARLPADCVAAEFLEKMNGFREPVVIPAALNPRPDPASTNKVMRSHAVHVEPEESSDAEQDRLEWVLDDGQDKIDMVIPEGLTVRRVSELYGPSETVPVIDVKAQEGEDKRWTMAKWADYYEQEGEKPVRNVISLEVSRSRLGRLIRRPKVVRDMDLQDDVWPDDDKAHAPPVQFYCLMSVADCYTDFHIDFGGSSVYYHIVKGRKTFFFIPPTKQNLKKYEEWCLSSRQSHDFLGQQVKECYRVDLYPGDTMLIPSGWIHAVWTPENSLVIGGNYLTRIHYAMQIKVVEIEKNTKVAPKFRYPFFQKIMWRALIKYLEEDPLPPTVEGILLDGGEFERNIPIYCEPEKFGHNSDIGPENYNRRYYPKAELEGLPDLMNYIWRTVLISQGKIEGISQTSRNAVNRSIPKSHGDPPTLARRFAMWIAWKRGNEQIPAWALLEPSLAEADKKLSAAQVKKIERESWSETLKLVRGGERHSSLRARASEPATVSNLDTQVTTAPPVTGFLRPHREHVTTPKTSQLGPKRIACDACRKRRIRCKHKDELVESPQSGAVAAPTSSSAMSGSPPAPSLGALAARRHSDAGIPASTVPFISTLLYDVQSTVNGGPVSTDLNAEALANKSGRVKACADCRKSKRRCIHDEYGNIDPVKAAETPVPRGSATKKRRVSDEHDGEALNKKIKQESFAGLVNGEVSQWNRYPIAKPRAASATEQRVAVQMPILANGFARVSPVRAIPIDPRLARNEEAVLDDTPMWDLDRTTVMSTIETIPDNAVQTSESKAPGDAVLFPQEPRTPRHALAISCEHVNEVQHSPGPSPMDHDQASPTLTVRSQTAKVTATPRKLKSGTPKSTPGKKGRRDSKETIKPDLKTRATSSMENEADMASLALAMKLQQEEYGLRRRSR